MVRFTGPGKIRIVKVPAFDPGALTIPNAASSPTIFLAILYNFDIDGDMLKPQHKAWLTEHVVPQLGDPRVKITLRGEASRTGSNAHDLNLSLRRVAQVINFLNANGPVLADISGKGAGQDDAEARGEDEKTEDELFRAVAVLVERSQHLLVPVVFDKVGSPYGFDPGANPPWVMIPTESIPRTMQIDNAEGLSLVSTNTGVASPQPALFSQQGPVKITMQSQKFRIQGGAAAGDHFPDAVIKAVDATGRSHARLAVSVLPALTVGCAFHYVDNPKYGTQTRKLGAEAEFVTRLNDIWTPRANIAFKEVRNARLLPLTVDLGDVIDTQAKFDFIANHRHQGVQFNVFFVREITNWKDPKKDTDAFTIIGPPGDCLFEDNIGGDLGLVISHEAGHCLTLDHNDPIVTTDDMLMHGDEVEAGNHFLPRVHVIQARSAVRSIG
jgi:hypothetical protein